MLVACPENSLIDSKDFFKPILTPFELEMALRPYVFCVFSRLLVLSCRLSGKDWTAMQYSSDFRDVLSDPIDEAAAAAAAAERDAEAAASGVTDRRIAVRDAGALLAQRTFRGLDVDAPAEAMAAVQGRSGVASGYDTAEGERR